MYYSRTTLPSRIPGAVVGESSFFKGEYVTLQRTVVAKSKTPGPPIILLSDVSCKNKIYYFSFIFKMLDIKYLYYKG
jgi:hypothetical protein